MLTAPTAFASGDANLYTPPSLTDGNNWYDRDAAAQMGAYLTTQPQPFTEACTWMVSQALWAGGLPQDETWNESDTHGRWLNYGDGSPTAANIRLLTQYILNRYPASYLQEMSFTGNDVPNAEVGDVVIYVWNGDGNWLNDGNQHTHAALVTNMDGLYPNVSDWGDADPGQVSPDAADPDHPWRGWTWSAKDNLYIQDPRHEPNTRAWLLHIDTSTPATY